MTPFPRSYSCRSDRIRLEKATYKIIEEKGAAKDQPKQNQELVDFVSVRKSFNSTYAVLAVVDIQCHVKDIVDHLKYEHID